ncbi:hypothetical protein PIB30_080694 [Stylosanthes scabra]|uniref:Uncharacterized protein n=1 Tax=Stylosanthes scabra TaxID=79078 RepID=A0ABU6WPQ8_9FABA|nr:hypothetical protein [Stylosanthes scabra]
MLSITIAPPHASACAIARPVRAHGGRVALGPKYNFRRVLVHFNPCDCTGPKTEYNGPPNRACDRTSGPHDHAVILEPLKHEHLMARKGKEVASASTSLRSRTTKNSNRGRDEGFPTERFDSQIHYDRWKTMEHRGITVNHVTMCISSFDLGFDE